MKSFGPVIHPSLIIHAGLKAGGGSASIMAASLGSFGLGLIALDRPPRGTALI